MTLTIDDDLYAKAVELTGIHDKSTLLHHSLIALVERESARRLTLLGGSETEIKLVPRRRSAI